MWDMFIVYISFSVFFLHLIERAWVWQWPELVDVPAEFRRLELTVWVPVAEGA